MEKKLILKSDILSALEKVGVRPGQVIMVHTSLGSIGYVCGGAQTMIEALIEAVGKDGTIMMPTQSWKNLDPETGVHWDVGKEEYHTHEYHGRSCGDVQAVEGSYPQRSSGKISRCIREICAVSDTGA